MRVVEVGSHSVAQASLELIAIILSQIPKSWDYRHRPQHLASVEVQTHCQQQALSIFWLVLHRPGVSSVAQH